MAWSATVLDEFRLSYDQSELDAHENRFSVYGAYETFKADTPNLIPGYQAFVEGRASAARTASIPVIQKQALTTSATRSCTAKTTQGTSAFVTPSWTTVETGFMMVPAEHQGNYLSYQQAFNNLARNVEKAFLLDADTDAVAHLVANLTGINNAEDNPWSITSSYMQVPLADYDMLFNELEAIMLANDITEQMINIVGSPRLKALVNEFSNQGVSNSTNSAFQYANLTFKYSNRVTISTAYHSTLYAMPRGSLAYLNWVDIDARLGHESGDGKKWYTVELPLFGQRVGVLYQSTCADKSSLLSGLNASLAESFQFSFDRAFVSSYDPVSTVDPGVIYGAEILKS
jgi:hypothetical protein